MNNFVFDPGLKFADPEKILFAAGLGIGQTLADFGSGSGFYTMAGGKIVGEAGLVYSVDILETALDHIAAEARLKGLRNVKTVHADLEQVDSCPVILTGSVDAVLFSNITHQIKDKMNLFGEAYRILKTGGKLLVVDWNDEPGLIGPPASDRLPVAEVNKLAASINLKPAGMMPVDIYHYGLVYIK
jgi:ubiquinone/menaquinone biosynthesis C-methylase UbiE